MGVFLAFASYRFGVPFFALHIHPYHPDLPQDHHSRGEKEATQSPMLQEETAEDAIA
jgi:hypothetical protein